jgi:hypothetical protein
MALFGSAVRAATGFLIGGGFGFVLGLANGLLPVTHDVAEAVPRPRERGDPQFAALEGEILHRLLDRSAVGD